MHILVMVLPRKTLMNQGFLTVSITFNRGYVNKIINYYWVRSGLNNPNSVANRWRAISV